VRLDLFSKANIVIGIQSPGEIGRCASKPVFNELSVHAVQSRGAGSEDREFSAITAPKSWRGRPNISGGYIEEAIPDPISNSVVKLFGADGTARATVWESRTPPG
jgi:hypothetical protein